VEALHLPVAAWPAGLRSEVTDAALLEQPSQLTAAGLLPGVVGHQSLCPDVVALLEGERSLEEADDGCGLLVVVDLGVGEPGVVVDDRVDDVDSVGVVAVLA
jgi:hypothetical protein